MAASTLKLSKSNLARGNAGRHADRLKELDVNGDGQLDLDEVCNAIDDIVRKEKTERTLKWLLAALALFSLLIVAATVGLTFAVVELSKDTHVDGSVLQSKDTGEAIRTGSFLQSQNVTGLLNSVAASADPGAALARITSIKVPSLNEGEAYTVYKVDAITMLSNKSVIVRTATGENFTMAADNLVAPPTAPAQAVQGSGRRLLLEMLESYSITIVQGPAEYDRKYTITDIAMLSVLTVGDIIDKLANPNMEGNPPDNTKVRLKASESSTGVLDRTNKLKDIPGLFTSATPTLYMEVRKLTIEFRKDLEFGSPTRPDQPVYVPVVDSWAGLKREIEEKYGYTTWELAVFDFVPDPDGISSPDEWVLLSGMSGDGEVTATVEEYCQSINENDDCSLVVLVALNFQA